MQLTSATLLVAGLAAQQATATWNLNAGIFSTCGNSDTKCSTEQHQGYDWSGLQIGAKVNIYGANTFSGGWTCNNIKSKRDELTKRTFGSKCISGMLPSWGASGSASLSGAGRLSIGCSGEKNKFSVSEMHLSSSYNTNIDCHYDMPDGSVCRQTVPCSSQGSIIKNTQCGGALSVSFSQGKGSPSNSGANSGKGGCNLNIHSVGFACGSSSTSVPASSATLVSPTFASSSAVFTSVPLKSTPAALTSTISSEVIFSSVSAVIPVFSSTPLPESQTSTLSMVSSSSVFVSNTPSSTEVSPVSASSSSSIVVSSGTGVYPSPSVPMGTGSFPSASLPNESGFFTLSSAIALGTGSSPSSSAAVAVVPVGTTSFPSSSSGPYLNSTTVSSTSTVSASSPGTSANVPDVVPSCLNTYLHNIECANNADADCYCKNGNFISDVYKCIDAYGGSDDNVSKAISYLIGICAKAVSGNPAIITAVPTSINITPSTTASSAVDAATAPTTSSVAAPTTSSIAAPITSSVATNSIVYVTDVVMSTVTTCPVGHVISTAGVVTTLTAASVIPTVFTTQSTITASIISSVTGGLPSGESAFETSPVETSPASVYVQVPQTVTLFSTQIATITSCAADVTNCPASSTVLSTSFVPTASTVSNIWIPVTTADETYSAETSSAVPTAASSDVSSGVISDVSSGVVSSTTVVGITSAVAIESTISTTVPAQTQTMVASGSSSVVDAASVSAAPQTLTIYSTVVATITSCASDVTNCPASSTVVSTAVYAVGTTLCY
jgi:hypothetical protein